MKTFFLQISDYESQRDTNDYLLMFGVIIFLFILGVFITRAIFSIPRFLKYQKAQTFLLLRIAKNNGLTDYEYKLIKDLINPDESSRIGEVKVSELLKDLDNNI
ncbi:hypothetical protein [Flavobacterium sedimenticola]|uniref:Uncharacterized protein n=1 Tax=Flavobacterium sedimenticola TaxID=3043286 RepID=A0ABT6XQA7_9FLAO|nr:hypothetical protein [Flavobacterium sedimenticola]MDI9257273.1 hypothetical protein [Flavobacterium sedimenticola]